MNDYWSFKKDDNVFSEEGYSCFDIWCIKEDLRRFRKLVGDFNGEEET